MMGTEIEISIAGVDKASADRAFAAAAKELERIENEMSEWKNGTPVSLVNRMAGIEPVKISDEVFKIISAAQKISELTDGAFDISWASMREVWDFAKGKERVPPPEEIKSKLHLVNYRNIILDPEKKTVFLKNKGMAIGLGAIAKGYAVDMAMQRLADMGIKNAIIKAGGDMRVQGKKDNNAWSIGIQHPRDKQKLLARFDLTNISISTSGDYERFFVKDGVLYHHIINPETGYPAKECQSVTILAPDTMTSDALSTAVFVLGPEKGMKLIRQLPGIDGIIVDSRGNISSSPGIEMAITAKPKAGTWKGK